MTLTDTIRRELWHAYNWRETIERTGALTTAEQVVESGVAEIEKAIAADIARYESNIVTLTSTLGGVMTQQGADHE